MVDPKIIIKISKIYLAVRVVCLCLSIAVADGNLIQINLKRAIFNANNNRNLPNSDVHFEIKSSSAQTGDLSLNCDEGSDSVNGLYFWKTSGIKSTLPAESELWEADRDNHDFKHLKPLPALVPIRDAKGNLLKVTYIVREMQTACAQNLANLIKAQKAVQNLYAIKEQTDKDGQLTKQTDDVNQDNFLTSREKKKVAPQKSGSTGVRIKRHAAAVHTYKGQGSFVNDFEDVLKDISLPTDKLSATSNHGWIERITKSSVNGNQNNGLTSSMVESDWDRSLAESDNLQRHCKMLAMSFEKQCICESLLEQRSFINRDIKYLNQNSLKGPLKLLGPISIQVKLLCGGNKSLMRRTRNVIWKWPISREAIDYSDNLISPDIATEPTNKIDFSSEIKHSDHNSVFDQNKNEHDVEGLTNEKNTVIDNALPNDDHGNSEMLELDELDKNGHHQLMMPHIVKSASQTLANIINIVEEHAGHWWHLFKNL